MECGVVVREGGCAGVGGLGGEGEVGEEVRWGAEVGWEEMEWSWGEIVLAIYGELPLAARCWGSELRSGCYTGVTKSASRLSLRSTALDRRP